MEIRPVNRADLPAIRDLFLRSVQEVAIRDYTPGQCAAWTAGADKPGWAERFLVTWTIGAFCEDQLAGFANLESPVPSAIAAVMATTFLSFFPISASTLEKISV